MFLEQIQPPNLDVHLCDNDKIIEVSPIIMFGCSKCGKIDLAKHMKSLDMYWEPYSNPQDESTLTYKNTDFICDKCNKPIEEFEYKCFPSQRRMHTECYKSLSLRERFKEWFR